jgi:hypothetical protein
MDKPETYPELVRICAGDGTVHRVSRATLAGCSYFQAKLARWESDVIELDVDDAPLRVVLTLLRYGAAAVPSLEPSLRLMVAKDADYLGVPRPLWAHLTADKPPAGPAGGIAGSPCGGKKDLSCRNCGGSFATSPILHRHMRRYCKPGVSGASGEKNTAAPLLPPALPAPRPRPVPAAPEEPTIYQQMADLRVQCAEQTAKMDRLLAALLSESAGISAPVPQ